VLHITNFGNFNTIIISSIDWPSRSPLGQVCFSCFHLRRLLRIPVQSVGSDERFEVEWDFSFLFLLASFRERGESEGVYDIVLII
jgi:hypothetical protein